jgi:hypothetical protein
MGVTALATFRGDTIIAASEGVCSAQRGRMARVWKFKRLVRSDGEVGFNLGRAGASHSIEVVFTNVAAVDVGSIFDRMDALDSGLSGDLVLCDLGTIPHCVLETCEPDKPTSVLRDPSTWNSSSPDEGYDLKFTLKFRQTRR